MTRSNIVTALLALIVIGTAYGLTADDPDKKVVLTPAEYRQAIAQARIDAARQALNAVRAERPDCILNWTTKPARPATM